MLLHLPAHPTGRADKKSKAKEEDKFHSPLTKGFHRHFYLHKAGVEAEERGTAVGSDAQGRKEQSLYHLHTNTMVMGRQTNW